MVDLEAQMNAQLGDFTVTRTLINMSYTPGAIGVDFDLVYGIIISAEGGDWDSQS